LNFKRFAAQTIMKALKITFQDMLKIVDILFNGFIINISLDIPTIPKVVDHMAINILNR
jgi:hypothetical protein